MIRAVVFDLDNTLTDFMKVKTVAVEAAVDAMIDAGLDAKLKLNPPEAREEALRRIQAIYDREGIEYQKVFNTFFTEAFGEVDYRLLASGIVGYRRARESALVPYPHVHWVLHRLLERGLKLAVVSDAPREQAWLRLVGLGLHYVFKHVITFEVTGKRKPAPEPFQAVLEKLQIEPGEALMVGDWPDRDMAGAKAVGMKTVFAHYGFSWSKDRGPIGDHPSDYTIGDILELLDIVDSINEPDSGPRGEA